MHQTVGVVTDSQPTGTLKNKKLEEIFSMIKVD
jgi:hypothetical protein